jgi:hypothetical protein
VIIKLEHRQAHFIGVDIGRTQDNSAVTVLARRIEAVQPLTPEPGTTMVMYYAVMMKRFPLQTPYYVVEDEIDRLWRIPEMATNEKYLIVDSTGVGSPVVENLIRLRHLPAQAVTITGGENARQTADGMYNVSKSNLVTALIDIVQRKRLKILEGVEDAEAFFNQLDVFGYRVNKDTGAVGYEAMMEKVHDDLVISTALALWYAERVRPYVMPDVAGVGGSAYEYDPLSFGREGK